jgi:hypothetical protein
MSFPRGWASAKSKTPAKVIVHCPAVSDPFAINNMIAIPRMQLPILFGMVLNSIILVALDVQT